MERPPLPCVGKLSSGMYIDRPLSGDDVDVFLPTHVVDHEYSNAPAHSERTAPDGGSTAKEPGEINLSYVSDTDHAVGVVSAVPSQEALGPFQTPPSYSVQRSNAVIHTSSNKKTETPDAIAALYSNSKINSNRKQANHQQPSAELEPVGVENSAANIKLDLSDNEPKNSACSHETLQKVEENISNHIPTGQRDQPAVTHSPNRCTGDRSDTPSPPNRQISNESVSPHSSSRWPPRPVAWPSAPPWATWRVPRSPGP